MSTDALNQLITVIVPALVTKLREDRELILTLRADIDSLKNGNTYEAALVDRMATIETQFAACDVSQHKLVQAMGDLTTELAACKDKLAELAERTPAPAVKRRRRKKNLARPEDLTPVDVLRANYALCATKGDVKQACSIMPNVSPEKMEYIEQMSSADIDDLYNPDLLGDEPGIDIKYAQTNWREVE